MLGKALLLAAGLTASVGANATSITLDRSGIDLPGASVDKTTIFDLPTQTTAFNFVGILDTIGSVQKNQDPETEFGLYRDDTLVKDISFFDVDTTNNTYAFSFLNLSAGNYSFRFNINGNESVRGYTFTSTITPVPESETYAMMMLGIGIMGLIARRKG